MKKIVFLLCLFLTFNAFAQDELPNVDLTTTEGETINIQDAADSENIVIVSLWATWCVPCLKELDAISEVWEEWQEETNVELIAVSVDDSRTVKRVKPLINGKGWDYTILLDSNNDLKRALGASTVPLTLLVKNGKIMHRHSGYSPGAEFELYEKIKELAD
ncbi:TlpA family protein disulfide reductase [Ulvibacter antarcticus]|uniref:Peroxiredoxin n=1 Tax=Ulvibacter antarcticus TaxID=442714 RepID=A0A3L9YAK2_9FLAO|nr:TlpA disulfide reductase family protein [Ulvibacter antarcticus]RMA57741.1 peroxiredoxin [Ulvibacter antarcticus]